MDDEPAEITPGSDVPVNPDPVPLPAAPMGRGFWAVMALIGVLILLIIYAQVQGVTKPVSVNLTGTNWTLTYYVNDNGTMVPVTNGTDVTIRFGRENGTIIGGHSGCNWYSYSYTSTSSTLSLARGSGVTTKMFCTAPGVMQVESTYLHNLENSTTVKFRSDHLYLYDTADKPLLIFEQTKT
ncbi:META domain-containing protein [Methanoregula sp.]|jgi:heat shock protein HslJ|uniref:META domain-containing protein n=1 Tax=Methanoregula sp. TaxID=2052170 RepID=UPI003569AB4C